MSCLGLKLQVKFPVSCGKLSETSDQLVDGASWEICLLGRMIGAAETGLVLVTFAKTSPTIQNPHENEQIGNNLWLQKFCVALCFAFQLPISWRNKPGISQTERKFSLVSYYFLITFKCTFSNCQSINWVVLLSYCCSASAENPGVLNHVWKYLQQRPKTFWASLCSSAIAMLKTLSYSAVMHFQGEKVLLKRCEQRIFLIFLLQIEESEMKQPPANGKEICMERRINALLLEVFSPNCYSHDFLFFVCKLHQEADWIFAFLAAMIKLWGGRIVFVPMLYFFLCFFQ